MLRLLVAAVLFFATVSSGVAGGCRMAHACAACPAPSTQVTWSANGGCAHMAPAAPRLAPTSFETHLDATPAASRVSIASPAPQLRPQPARADAGRSVEASPPLVLRV